MCCTYKEPPGWCWPVMQCVCFWPHMYTLQHPLSWPCGRGGSRRSCHVSAPWHFHGFLGFSVRLGQSIQCSQLLQPLKAHRAVSALMDFLRATKCNPGSTHKLESLLLFVSYYGHWCFNLHEACWACSPTQLMQNKRLVSLGGSIPSR